MGVPTRPIFRTGRMPTRWIIYFLEISYLEMEWARLVTQLTDSHTGDGTECPPSDAPEEPPRGRLRKAHLEEAIAIRGTGIANRVKYQILKGDR
jgi:hypothetical protein